MQESINTLINPIEEIGYHSFYSETFFNDLKLTTGTCFCYKKNEDYFLVTNYHILSGRNPVADEQGINQPLHDSGAIPNKIKVWIYGWEFLDKKYSSTGVGYSFDIPILSEDEKPLYKTRKMGNGDFYDVAVLPLKSNSFPIPEVSGFESGSNNKPIPANRSLGGLNYKFNLNPTDEVFILGYPFGKLGPHTYLPIWKRGSIATSLKACQYFLVDTATRSGMSGSPVYIINSDIYSRLFINWKFLPKEKGYKARLIGVYSGRIIDNQVKTDDAYKKIAEEDLTIAAQLGKVWEIKIVEDIIDSI